MAIEDGKANLPPTEEDYYHAALRLNDLAAREGQGIAWYLNNELRKAPLGSLTLRRTMVHITHLASRSAESRIDTQCARSIKLGGIAGALLSFDVHGDVLFMKDIVGTAGVDVHDTSELLDEQIKTIGEAGLEVVGSRAADMVEKWSKVVDRSPELQTLFRHCFGVVALGADKIQRLHNPTFADFKRDYADFSADSPEFDAEIAAFFGDSGR